MLPEDTKEERDPAECNVSDGRYGGMDKEDVVHISNGASLPHEKKVVGPHAATWTDLEPHTE